MKKLVNGMRFILVATLIYSCSEPKKPQATVVEKTPAPISVKEKFIFEGSHYNILKEHIFFFLRENAIHIDRNTFVKYEALKVEGMDFEYTAVIIDKGMLNSIGKIDITRKVSYASLFSNQEQEEDITLGDSISVKGKIIVVDTQKKGIESQVSNVTIKLEAEYETSFVQASAYGYGELDRIGEGYNYNEELIVDLNRPYIFNKNDLYLKARISELTKEDLTGLSKEDLAYLRNEIFARHGHTFKTEKMMKYFEYQMWYKPYMNDATPTLNELEKKNAQFIRSLES